MNLSVKIIFVLGFYILGVLSMGLVSYDDLRTTEEKVEFLDLAYNLHNIILEVRRYEKNYLLYNKEEAFRENKRYLALARDTGKALLARADKYRVAPMVRELDGQIVAYEATMDQFSQQPSFDTINYTRIEDRLRDQGKLMTESSKNLADFERSQIHLILTVLKRQLVSWGFLAVMIGIILSLLIIYYVFKPLFIIKKATEDIAKGRFNKIEVINTRDEMQQVMEAFNTMVFELGRRQDQLVQSKKLSSIGTLTAGVAHQLNNPLNNISTSCQIAMDELAAGDPAFLMRMLKNIDHETLRARDVVQGLLEFSRVKEFSLRPSQLQAVVKRAVQLAQSQVPADIDIVLDVPEQLVFPMDAQRLQEVFINLIINATHSIKGSGRITILAEQDANAGEVRIEVRDTGHGIPEEIQGQLFDPFYTTKEEGKGTGLGLSVAYGIIQQHHGNITVHSTPGEGASFFIHLPMELTNNNGPA
jgi:signal transduction histidine kinase